jgi:hypothetical protein
VNKNGPAHEAGPEIFYIVKLIISGQETAWDQTIGFS